MGRREETGHGAGKQGHAKKTEEEEQWACAPTLAHAGERKREAGRGPGAGLRKKRSRPSGLIRERENFPFLFYFQNQFKCKPNQI